MQKVNSLPGKWQNVVFFLTALLVVYADQLSKLWIRSNLAIGESLFEVGIFSLTHLQNTGAAFGLFRGQSFPLTIVAIISAIALLFYALFIYRLSPLLDTRVSKIALGLVLGGTVGNLVDRVHFGGVTDFIKVGFWPTFNIADSALTVGVILFAYSFLRLARAESH